MSRESFSLCTVLKFKQWKINLKFSDFRLVSVWWMRKIALNSRTKKFDFWFIVWAKLFDKSRFCCFTASRLWILLLCLKSEKISLKYGPEKSSRWEILHSHRKKILLRNEKYWKPLNKIYYPQKILFFSSQPRMWT